MRWGSVGIVVVAALVAAAVAPSAAAEGPTNFSCDETGRLACAGAAGGGTAHCGPSLGPVADCSYTYGWITEGLSRAGLPGEAVSTADVEVRLCSSMDGCFSTAAWTEEASCRWAPGLSCQSQGTGDGAFPPRALRLGECVTLTVTVTAAATATTLGAGLPTLADADHEDVGTFGDQVCLVDDGR